LYNKGEWRMNAWYRRCFAILVLIISGVMAAPLVFAETTYSFNLPEQSLADSLRAIGQQTEINILFEPNAVKNARSPALRGQYTVDEAIRLVLAGTKLEAQHTAASNVVIKLKSARSTTLPATTSAASDPPVRVAQVDQNPAGPQAVEKNKGEESDTKKKTAGLEEIVVTGSRIPTAAGQQTLPVRSYTREDIEQSGQVTITDFLNTLPDVSTASREDGFAVGIHGVTTVQLHGLPVGTTLTLLDGRRVETSFLGFFDLSNIPPAAIERVEILPVGASAIYGADALAGAVNIILRKDYDGLELNGSWGHATGVSDSGVNLAWGKTWDRGSVSLVGIYQDRGELLGSEREPTSATDFPANAPTAGYLLGDCAPGNVFSLNGQNLPGLNSPQAAIPTGITGKPTIGQFVATAGQQNQCNFFRNVSLLPDTQRTGALLSAHYAIAESVDLFTEVMFSNMNLHARTGLGLLIDVPTGDSAILAANNPYNPFGEDVGVGFSYPGIVGPLERTHESLIRPLIGMRGTLFSDWHYEATAYLSRDHLDSAEPGINTQSVLNALGSSDPATALNPFTTGAPGTPQLLQSLQAIDPNSSYYARAADQIVFGQGFLRGPLFSLPGGPVQVVVGGEYGQEKQDTDSGPGSLATPIDLQRKTYAVFSEARVPLFSSEGSQTSERLALTLAGRYDHSDDYGGKATWQSGLLWRATNTLSFNSSYGVSYQAPTLADLTYPLAAFNGPTGALDPFRGNEPVSALIIAGPNPKLNPETGDAFTLGLTYSSEALHGLRASLNYYDLRISNYISTHSFQDLIDNPDLFPGAIVRAPPTAQDLQQGYLGQIEQINDIPYNFGDLRVTGVDADISYAIDTALGRFTPSLAVANVLKWLTALTPNSPEINYVSQADNSLVSGAGWAPRWKGTAALAWQRGPLSMNVSGRYVGPYRDYQYVPNSNELGNSWFVDMNARYEIGQALAGSSGRLAHSYISVGVVDLLDKTPPFSYGAPWDNSQYDIRGRYVYVKLGLKL